MGRYQAQRAARRLRSPEMEAYGIVTTLGRSRSGVATPDISGGRLASVCVTAIGSTTLTSNYASSHARNGGRSVGDRLSAGGRVGMFASLGSSRPTPVRAAIPCTAKHLSHTSRIPRPRGPEANLTVLLPTACSLLPELARAFHRRVGTRVLAMPVRELVVRER